MATTKIAYATHTAITATAVTTTLAAGEYAASAIVDNTSNLYMDAQVGGSFATGASHTTGDTFDIYGYANYDSGTSTDIGGSIGTTLDGTDSEETEGTGFNVADLVFLGSFTADQASTTFHFYIGSVAQAFGGTLPPKWGLMFHNNGTGAMASGFTCGYNGITYTSA